MQPLILFLSLSFSFYPSSTSLSLPLSTYITWLIPLHSSMLHTSGTLWWTTPNTPNTAKCTAPGLSVPVLLPPVHSLLLVHSLIHSLDITTAAAAAALGGIRLSTLLIFFFFFLLSHINTQSYRILCQTGKIISLTNFPSVIWIYFHHTVDFLVWIQSKRKFKYFPEGKSD